MKIFVVGSGPAGVAVTKGLLEQGFAVTMVDVGNQLEPEKRNLLNKIKISDQYIDTKSLKQHANAKNHLKMPYGSSFVYDKVMHHFRWKTHQCHFQHSFAQGGLSNVWGGVIGAYTPNNLSDWPIECRDLSIYYERIRKWFGSYSVENMSSNLSQQAYYLHETWNNHYSDLKNHGFHFKIPLLAMDTNQCRFCGACQYGCPYELIYNSAFHVNALKKHRHFTYLSSLVVDRFSEQSENVELFVKNIQANTVSKLFADRVFIACGAGLSSLLYLRSLNRTDKPLILKDSQHFVLPCLLDKPFPDVSQERLHSLCQLSMSLVQKDLACFPVYMQLYTYMDQYLQEMRLKFKGLYGFIKPLASAFLNRLVIIQGYLHSEESNRLAIQYQTNQTFQIIKKTINPAKKTIKDVVCYLKQHQEYLALKPLPWLLTQSLPGQSNHVGGSLGMSSDPQQDEVDIWGRPVYFSRVHFVDGSILPSIPAGPITLTIMANAYRIGKEVPL